MSTLNWMVYSAEPCYVCGRKLGNKTPHVAYLIDDDNTPVFVGSECINKIIHADAMGLASAKGKGPRVFASEQLACSAGMVQS